MTLAPVFVRHVSPVPSCRAKNRGANLTYER